jgi:DNA-binding response OmpR family regulator
MTLPRVLVVEDELLIGESLVRALASQQYEAQHATTVAEAITAMVEWDPDLVLLDVMLPDGDGIAFCQRLSQQYPTMPVVMLTARVDEMDIVAGLQAGAVDYVTKPFRLAELFARVATHLRFASVSSDVTGAESERVVIGALQIDVAGRRVSFHGEDCELRPKEFDLLARLAFIPGAVVSREELIADVWDEHWWGSTKTLDVHINALRRKLGIVAGESGPISTIRGVGYRLEAT